MRSMVVFSLVPSLFVSILFGTSAAAQEATPMATPVASPVAGVPPAVILVQSFTVGSLEPTGEPGAATLMLQGPVGETVYFADQPNRIAGAVALVAFLQVLAQGAATPLPAALVIDRPEGDQVVLLELLDGSVDAAGTVTYNVRVLADASAFATDMTQSATPLTDVSQAIDFGPSHLFVDSSGGS